ncbi:MAG: glycosyltransferase [Oscillospiraceae bacterium]|nr:glycosyltransferase [Oscillospiraceae bacterium]
MNVAILTDSFPPMIDGVSRCALGYANALHEHKGGSCIVIAPRVPSVNYSYPFPVYTYKSVGLPYAEYRAGHPFIPWLVAKLKAMNVDILHVHSPFISMTLARQLRFFLNVPIIFTQHTKWSFDISRAVSVRVPQKMIAYYAHSNISTADEVWAVSRGAGEYLLSHGYRGDFVVMPNATDFPVGGVDTALLRGISSQFGLPDSVPVLLFVGRIMWYKNIRLIIEALSILNGQSFDFRMLFVGDGDDLTDAKELSACMGLSEVAFFAGTVSDRELLRAYFTRSDLFVFPSVYDNAPLVIREAAACRCPSLVVRNSSASEILEDGVSGFFAEEAAESIAHTIKAALSDSKLLKKVASNAFEQVYLPWDKAISNSIARYEEVKQAFDRKLR